MLKAKNNNKRDAQCFKESNAMLNAIRGASDAQHDNWRTPGVASICRERRSCEYSIFMKFFGVNIVADINI